MKFHAIPEISILQNIPGYRVESKGELFFVYDERRLPQHSSDCRRCISQRNAVKIKT
jgi:hypothetical protein